MVMCERNGEHLFIEAVTIQLVFISFELLHMQNVNQ